MGKTTRRIIEIHQDIPSTSPAEVPTHSCVFLTHLCRHTIHTIHDMTISFSISCCVFEILNTMTHSMALHLSVFCYLDTLIWLENHFKVNTKRSRNSRKKDDQSLFWPILGGSERRKLLYNTQLGHKKPCSIKELVQTHPVHPYPKKEMKRKKNSTETLLFSPKSREERTR